MFKLFFTAVVCLSTLVSHGQSLPVSRSTDWTLAGLRDTTTPTNLVVFSGQGDGVTDHTIAFQTLLSTVSAGTIIQFDEGIFLFSDEIILPSNVVVRGKGAGVTHFKFNMGGAAKDCFQAQGGETGNFVLTAAASKEDFILDVNNANVAVGDYIRMIQDDSDLLNDSWAYNRTGQVSQVAAVTATQITLTSPLRMDFPLSRNPYLKKVTAIKNVGLECFTLERVDQVTVAANRNKTSKIRFSRAVNSWVKGVESINCNYAHFEALYSANVLVSGCYFHDAFENGDGGRAYGVMLHFATSESKVENTIFKSLRHAMIVQAGANGNVFAYNYSRDANKSWYGFTFDSEDMMSHGNYPYLNLFESNVCEWPKVDASHGNNGPYNTFFRNRSTDAAFTVSSVSGGNNNQNFLGNEGAKSISGSGHQETLNSWQSASGTLEASLAYTTKPDFLTAAEFGAIGFPNFATSAVNPAFNRYQSGDFTNAFCGSFSWDGTQWENAFVPDNSPINYKLTVADGNICTLSADAHFYAAQVKPGGRLDLGNGVSFTVQDSIYLQAEVGKYAQFLGDVAVPASFEIVIENAGWHYVCSPMSTGTVAQLEKDLKINFAGNTDGPNLFTWNPNGTAGYVAVTDNTANVAGTAFNIFVANSFVKSGRGVNNDGKLPVKITWKGMANNGQTANSTLGVGMISPPQNVTGDPTGWNLICNPYPSAIDLNEVFAVLPANYESGAHLFNAQTGAFEVRSKSGINANATSIAPGQAFFVKLNTGADINPGFYDFENTVRTIDVEPPFLKRSAEGFSLNLSDQENNTESIRFYFSPVATENYNAATDISRFILNDKNSAFTAIKMDGEMSRNLVVAAFPEKEMKTPIPLHINCTEAGYYSMSISSIIGFNDEIFVEDILEGNYTNVKKSNVFFIPEGNFENRFFLHFLPRGTSVEDHHQKLVFTPNQLSIFYATALPKRGHINLCDVNGRLVFKSEDFETTGVQSWALDNLSAGVYVLQIFEDDAVRVEKLILAN